MLQVVETPIRPNYVRDQPWESGTLLLATLDGRVRFATGRASVWLDAYFGERNDRADLPPALTRWLTSEQSASISRRAPDGRTELEVIILRSDADGAFCLVLNEKNVAGSAFSAALQNLTRREEDVLAWLTQGKSNAEIAAVLQIELATVKKHLQNIFVKLGVHSRMAAAGFVMRATENRELRERTRCASGRRGASDNPAERFRVMPPAR